MDHRDGLLHSVSNRYQTALATQETIRIQSEAILRLSGNGCGLVLVLDCVLVLVLDYTSVSTSVSQTLHIVVPICSTWEFCLDFWLTPLHIVLHGILAVALG